MKKKIEELTSKEHELMLSNKRNYIAGKYKEKLIRDGFKLKPNDMMLLTLVRKTYLVDKDLENEEITGGVFPKEA